MILLTLVLCCTVFVFFNILLRFINGGKKFRRPPGPKGLPIIGNMHQFDSIHPHLYLYDLGKKYGNILSLKFGSRLVYVFQSARLAKEVFKTNDAAFAGRPKFQAFQALSYNGLDIVFSPYDDNWRGMRKLSVLHLFGVKQVASFWHVRKDEVAYTINEIAKKAKANEIVNLSQEVFFLANRIICRVAFGGKYERKGKRKFDDLFKEVQQFAAGFFVSDYFPFFGWLDRLRGLVPMMERSCKELDEFYEELIRDHLDPNRPESMKGDLLDLLIEYKKTRSDDSESIDWNNIKAVIVDILIAGTDTSATTSAWVMTVLMQKPDIMVKVQKEIRDLVGNKGSVDENDVQNLPYLKAVIKETFRLFPPAVLSVAREVIEECNIDGYVIPKDALVYVSYYSVGRDPEYWENPTEFDPDRFLKKAYDFRGQDFGFIPFGSGRRGCPAYNLAIASIELTLANLLYAFNWEMPKGLKAEDMDMDIYPGITNIKKVDLHLVAHTYL